MGSNARQQGVFIALEGLDGCGKDTQIEFLKKRPELEGAVFTREPGGTEAGAEMRETVLKTRTPPLTVEAEMMLFFGARAEHVAHVIRPALAAGKIVVSNRFSLSTLAYEVEGPPRPDLKPLFDECVARIVGDTLPHYILLDIPAELAVERMRDRGGTMTQLDVRPLEFHERIRKSMLAHVSDDAPGAVVDGAQSPEKVAEAVWQAVSSWL